MECDQSTLGGSRGGRSGAGLGQEHVLGARVTVMQCNNALPCFISCMIWCGFPLL